MRKAGLLATAAIALTACGDTGAATAESTSAHGALVKIVPSRYGRVVADSKGEALYLFTRDGRGKSRCYGDCAKAWPPFLTGAKPRAGKGVSAAALGTRRRSDGKLQVTYRGQPLYYYVADRPGVILCQDVNEFGGDWLVVAPSGHAVR